MLSIPNIYHYKNLKLLIAIPVLLLIISLYLTSSLVLDTSLKGGVSVTVQTNTTQSISAIASAISSRLNVPQPSIQASPGSMQITLPANQSIASAQDALANFFTNKSAYDSFVFNRTALQLSLKRDSSNSTLQAQLINASKGANSSFVTMTASLNRELVSLVPIIGVQSFNSSSEINMSDVAEASFASATAVYRNKVIAGLHLILPFSVYSYQEVSPTLGRFFLGQVQFIIIVAFILTSIIVFFVFKSVVPAFAVIFGAANDMIIALGAMALFRIPLGLASLGGLLMLIGYSFDTDMLTSIRILKRHEGTPEDRAYSAMRTGITMTLTATVSFAILFIVSLIAYIPTYYEISGVVLCGLIGDILTTWFGNAAIILLYKKRKDHVK